jgi:2'-5' RNA ligase
MGAEANGMPRCIPAVDGVNIFAVVIYIPDPLRHFLDDLRRELVPHDNPHAHVSVLPPRSLAVDCSVASNEARKVLEECRPFEIELTTLEVFRLTDVIYIDVGAGADELRRLHQKLNSSALHCCEPYPYHPHITLAQEIPAGAVERLRRLAAGSWAEFSGQRKFLAERAVFVQNTVSDSWVDLASYSLGTVAAKF